MSATARRREGLTALLVEIFTDETKGYQIETRSENALLRRGGGDGVPDTNSTAVSMNPWMAMGPAVANGPAPHRVRRHTGRTCAVRPESAISRWMIFALAGVILLLLRFRWCWAARRPECRLGWRGSG